MADFVEFLYAQRH